jgi:nicotinamidase-related amidase
MDLGNSWALLVIDMQNGFCHELGFMGRYGLAERSNREVIDAVGRLLAVAREVRAPIFHTRFTLNADESDAGLAVRKFGFPGGDNGLVQGTWGWRIVDELQPLDGERVIDKPRYSAFHRTSLADELRELGIERIVVCGVTSNVCVESTVRHAFDSDIMPVVAADATAAANADLYRAALASFQDALAEVADVATLTSAMKGDARAAAGP